MEIDTDDRLEDITEAVECLRRWRGERGGGPEGMGGGGICFRASAIVINGSDSVDRRDKILTSNIMLDTQVTAFLSWTFFSEEVAGRRSGVEGKRPSSTGVPSGLSGLAPSLTHGFRAIHSRYLVSLPSPPVKS